MGKKPDKKIAKESSDVIDEGDGLSLVSCVLFTDTGGTQKVSEGEFGDLTLGTVRLFCEETNAAEFPHPAWLYKSISLAASSGQAGRPQAGKESSKAKKNRTIKISKISSVSQNWRASMVREIANANELKHLDEFLLNKVKGSQPW